MKEAEKEKEKRQRRKRQEAGKAPAGGKRKQQREQQQQQQQQQQETVRRVLDSLRGQRVIARDESDGLYYSGLVHHCPDMRNASIQFDDAPSSLVLVPTRFCIPICGALSTPVLRTGDPVLMQVKNKSNSRICYAPARILVPPKDESKAGKVYAVRLYNGKRCTCRRSGLVKIGDTRYSFLVRTLKMKNGEVEQQDAPTPKKKKPQQLQQQQQQQKQQQQQQQTRMRSVGKQREVSAAAQSPRKQQQKQQQQQQPQQQQKQQPQQQQRQQRRKSEQANAAEGADEGDVENLRTDIRKLKRQLRDIVYSYNSEKTENQEKITQLEVEIDRLKAELDSRKAAATDRYDSVVSEESERPPQRMELRPEDEQEATESELARLADEKDTDDAVQPRDSVSQQAARTDRSNPPKVGEEVVARWSDDGWYYRCLVERKISDTRFVVVDGNKHSIEVDRADIIREGDDALVQMQRESTVVALHPDYANSYAPAVVLADSSDAWVRARFYDGVESPVPRQDCYCLAASEFEAAVSFIVQREKMWVGKPVIARDNRTGCYLPATVLERVGTGRQYKVEFASGQQQLQALEFIFGALSRSYRLREGDRVLARAGSSRRYLPGWVQSITPDSCGDRINVKLVDGSSCRGLQQHECNWISKEFFDNAVNYWRNRHEA